MSREMTNSEAISNLNHIYGIVSPDIQRSLDLAIKALEEKPKDCSDCKRYDSPYFEIKIDKEQMQELVNKAKAEVLISIEQGEWVTVSERLPNRNGVYNVTRKLKEGETIYFISDASYFDGQNTWHADTGINHGRQYLTDIIAWQPLPEPYKKDCEKNER